MPVSSVRRDSVLVGVATQPPAQAAAAALAERLRNELYQEPALVPASPWLSKRAPRRPVVALRIDPSSREQVVSFAPVTGDKVAWWTVRALGAAGWRSWVIPGREHQLIVGPATSNPTKRVIVTAVDRFGLESSVRDITWGPH